jgi:hypothetical protein
MSRNKLWLRLVGDLPPSEELTRHLGLVPTTNRRQGMPTGLDEPQKVDVWSVELIERDRWTRSCPDERALAEALGTLRRVAPLLASLDRTGWSAELYLSTIRDEEQGGFYLPRELVDLAAKADLAISVSILVAWPDDDESSPS